MGKTFLQLLFWWIWKFLFQEKNEWKKTVVL